MDLQQLSKQNLKKVPNVKAGDIVRVTQEITEGDKKRNQVFEGIVLKTQGGNSPGATFCVRRISFGVGIERIFLTYSPLIKKIQVLKSNKVRRAKLYYLRNTIGKKVKMKEKALKTDVVAFMAEEDEREKQEKQTIKDNNAKKEKEIKEKDDSKKDNSEKKV
jgi:large subunit ribosomal protein L19